MKYYLGFLDISENKKFNISWEIIAAAQDSRIVHTFMVYELPEGLMIYEATDTKFNKNTLESRVTTSNVKLFQLPGSAEKALAYDESILNAPYDFVALLGLGIPLILERVVNILAYPFRKLFGIKKPVRLSFSINPLNMKRAFFCSESCIKTMQAAIPNLPFDASAGNTSPSQLYYDYILPNRKFFGDLEFTAAMLDGKAIIVADHEEVERWIKSKTEKPIV